MRTLLVSILSFCFASLSLFILGYGNDTEIVGAKPLTETEFTIFLQGDSGIQFTGNIMITKNEGSSVSKSVEGKVPAVFDKLNGSILSCSFQKTEGNSNKLLVLVTDIEHFPTPIKSLSTTAQFGIVTITVENN